MDIFRTLIVTADSAPLAREIAASFSSGGSGEFTTPLSADGLEPVSHYISSGYMPEQFVIEIEAVLATSDISEDEPFATMARLGLMIVNPPVEGAP